MRLISNLFDIAGRYDAFIIDLWGVVHDGSHLYPGVRDGLTELRRAGKKIVMLSNAPRRVAKVAKVLGELGIGADLYDAVYSSGEAGYSWLAANGKIYSPPNYYYIGPAKDADVLNGLDCKRVDDLKSAGFLLNVGFGSEEQACEDYMPLLRAACASALPMLCLNPDLEVVKQTGERFPCAGVIGNAYARLGGKVRWFGKPYADVYTRCMEILAPLSRTRVLAIGDSLDTDIAGAINFNIDCVLVSGGILKELSLAEIQEMCLRKNLRPPYIMPKFCATKQSDA